MKRKNSFSRNLLLALVIGGVIVVAATNPLFGLKAIGAIQKELKRRKWRQFQDDLYYLKRRGFVNVESAPDGSYIVGATKLGKEKAKKYNLDNLSIKTPKQWDGYWRLVIFDIPTGKQKARFALLSKLKELGFVLLQKSIWAHPFECKKEISVLVKVFEVEGYVHLITSNDISAGDDLRRDFEKKNGMQLA